VQLVFELLPALFLIGKISSKRKFTIENELKISDFSDFKSPKFKKTIEENNQISILDSHRQSKV